MFHYEITLKIHAYKNIYSEKKRAALFIFSYIHALKIKIFVMTPKTPLIDNGICHYALIDNGLPQIPLIDNGVCHYAAFFKQYKMSLRY